MLLAALEISHLPLSNIADSQQYTHADTSKTTMNATAIDSRIFRNLFGTEEARQIFSDEQYVSRMIDVETGLARAQATANIVPQEAAEAITAECNVQKIK